MREHSILGCGEWYDERHGVMIHGTTSANRGSCGMRSSMGHIGRSQSSLACMSSSLQKPTT